MQAGQGLLLGALKHISQEGAETKVTSRIGIIYNPRNPSQEPSLLARLLMVMSQLTSRRTKIAGTVSSKCTAILSMFLVLLFT